VLDDRLLIALLHAVPPCRAPPPGSVSGFLGYTASNVQ
jgi:hypothetical protein